jgi:hypothetical protein
MTVELRPRVCSAFAELLDTGRSICLVLSLQSGICDLAQQMRIPTELHGHIDDPTPHGLNV